MRVQDLNFDVDHYLNRFIPRNHLHRLPKPISRFLGYRNSGPPRIGNVLTWWWAFIGAFAGLLVVEAVFQSEQLRSEGTPMVIASLGAAAILEYHVIESPLSQPRNAIFGQIFSATVGISITKLFQHSSQFESLRWVAGALSVGVASAVMGITKTVHPPAGATALMCATSPDITVLGWFLLPLIILGSVLLVAVGCVLNNIERQFPMYWWTPADFDRKGRDDIERAAAKEGMNVETANRLSSESYIGGPEGRIMISAHQIVVPDWLPLDEEQREWLEIFRTKLRGSQRLESTASRESGTTQVPDTGNDTQAV